MRILFVSGIVASIVKSLFITTSFVVLTGGAVWGESIQPAPRLDIQRGGTSVSSGETDLVNVAVDTDAPINLRYVLANSGSSTLELRTPVSISGQMNCSASVTTQPDPSVAPGESTNLVVSITPPKTGVWSFNVSIKNNAPNPNPFNWTTSGTVTPKGDLNGNMIADLADAILGLKTLSLMNSPGINPNYAASGADVDGDNRIGLPEVIYLLRVVQADRALFITWCNIEHPTDLFLLNGAQPGDILGRIQVSGLTDLTDGADTDSRLRMQLGIGPAGTSAESWDMWIEALPAGDSLFVPSYEIDTYVASFSEPLPSGAHDFSFRVSGDGGATWMYANANRSPHYNGTDVTHPYDRAKNGVLWIAGTDDPCSPNPCREPFRTVCENNGGSPSCHCGEDAHEEGISCVPNVREVSCTNQKPDNSQWKWSPNHDAMSNVLQTWDGTWKPPQDACPWECEQGTAKEDDGAGNVWCEPVRNVACTNEKPGDSLWKEALTYPELFSDGNVGYLGDGTVTQYESQGAGWLPTPDACPWECEQGTAEAYDGIGNVWCEPVRNVACTNQKPDNSLWKKDFYLGTFPEGNVGYLGDGTVTQYEFQGAEWLPKPYACPWECEQGTAKAVGPNGELSCVPVRNVACTNQKPDNSLWKQNTYEFFPDGNVGHLGDGTVTQFDTLLGWAPDSGNCPWECEQGTTKAVGPYGELSCVPVRNVACTNQKPDNSHWKEELNYSELSLDRNVGYLGDGTVTQVDLLGWTPDPGNCPWECDEGINCGTPTWLINGCGIIACDGCTPGACIGEPGVAVTRKPTPVSAYHWYCTSCPSTRIQFPDGSYLVMDNGRGGSEIAELHPSTVEITTKY